MSEVVLFVLVFLVLIFVGLWLVKLLFVPRKQGGFEDLEHRMNELKIEIGKELLPAFEQMARGCEQAAQSMATFADEFKSDD